MRENRGEEGKTYALWTLHILRWTFEFVFIHVCTHLCSDMRRTGVDIRYSPQSVPLWDFETGWNIEVIGWARLAGHQGVAETCLSLLPSPRQQACTVAPWTLGSKTGPCVYAASTLMDLTICLTSFELLILDCIYLARYGTPHSYPPGNNSWHFAWLSEHHVCEASVGRSVLCPLLRLFSKQIHTLLGILGGASQLISPILHCICSLITVFQES